MINKILKFFDKLEDRIRATLSHYTVLYALIGGVAIVLFWRGVWKLADEIGLGWFLSISISAVVLLLTGLFVSFFVGDLIVLSGLKREKKLIEKTEEEVETEMELTNKILKKLDKIEREMEEIKNKL